MILRTLELSWADFWQLATTDRALAAYRLTFGASLVAAVANAVFGTLLAWVLVRYEFPGRRFIDAMVDFPFALPTAVAGLTLANLFAANGWLGQFLVPLGIKGAYTPLGVVIALTFVGLPFVVRTLQPVLENLEREVEEAAATLGAGRLRTFVSVIAPSLLPAVLTGFALAFARAIGEYGSIVFISGNLPFKTEIAPYLIVMRLEEYDYTGRHRAGGGAAGLLVPAARRPSTCSNNGRAVSNTDMAGTVKRNSDRGPARFQARDGRIAASSSGCSSSSRWRSASCSCCCRWLNVFAQALRAKAGAITGNRWSHPDSLGGDPPHAAGGGHQRAAECAFWPGRRLGHRQVRVPRQIHSHHADRPAVLGLAGRGRA